MKFRWGLFFAIFILILVSCVAILSACDSVEQTENNNSIGETVYFTVNFDSQGGNDIPSISIKKGDSILNMPIPVKNNYIFIGWYMDAGYCQVWDSSKDVVLQDIILYAKWIPEDGVILSVENAEIDGYDIFMAVHNNIDFVKLADTVQIQGDSTWKLFNDKLGTKEIPTKIAANSYGILNEGDNIFYLVTYAPNGKTRTYSLTIHRSFCANIVIYNPYGEPYKTIQKETYFDYYIPDEEFEGYDVDSWSSSDILWYSDSLIRKNTDFHPECTAKNFDVLLDSAGGDISQTEIILTYDNTFSLPIPEKEENVFIGWSEDGTVDKLVTDRFGNGIGIWKTIGACTLYAVWVLNSYNVEVETNNELNSGSVIGEGNYEYEENVTIQAITNVGYTFVGWYDNGEQVCTSSTYTFKMPAFDKKIVAKWETNSDVKNFKFVSTINTLGIVDVLDKSVYEIEIPQYDNVSISILEGAFAECKNLRTITISKCVSSIGNKAFSSCTNLTEIIWNTNSVGDLVTGNEIFDNAGNQSDGINLIFGNIVEKVPAYLFENCANLANVSFGQKVSCIGNSAFYGCQNLHSITIPESIINIGNEAFNYCTGLTEIIWNTNSVGDLVTGNEIFDNAGNQNDGINLIFGNIVEKVPAYLFENCANLANVSFGQKVSCIGNSAFYGCQNLHSITIPESIINIGNEAFNYCTGLTEIIWNTNSVGDLVTGNEIFDNAGNQNDGINLIFGNAVENIPAYLFENCISLAKVSFGRKVSSISNTAFYGCTNFASIVVEADNDRICSVDNCIIERETKTLILGCRDSVIPSDTSVEKIGDYAFYGCSGLTSIIIPDNIIYIGADAFKDCINLKDVDIGSGISYLPSGLFNGCCSIVTMKIPFIGAEVGAVSLGNYQYPFGYLFGTQIYDTGVAIEQYLKKGQVSSKNIYYLPSTLRNVTVKGGSIHYGAFINCYMIESIFIPDNVEEIEGYAFCGCKALVSFELPSNLSNVGNNAFEGCISLTDISIPDGVNTINQETFKNCSNLQIINIGKGVSRIQRDAFNGCNNLIQVNYAGDLANWCAIDGLNYLMVKERDLYINGNVVQGDITVPSGVEYVKAYSFAYQKGISSVTFAKDVVSIEQFAFKECINLVSVVIPDSVTNIGTNVFLGCKSIENITLPFIGKTIDTLGTLGDLFGQSSNNSLKHITITGGDFVSGAFNNCTALTSVSFNANVKNIDNSAFKGCSSLIDVYYSGDITSWCNINFGGHYANPLYYAKNLYINGQLITELNIPDGIESIKDFAFESYANLTSVALSNSVRSVGACAFRLCKALVNVNLSESLQFIGDNAFSGCSKITQIELPENLTYIGEEAFSSCSELLSITLGDKVETLGSYAFYDCSKLSTVNIGSSVEIIERAVFYGCSSLNKINIPDSVTAIKDSAFYGCSGLKTVNFGAGVRSIGEKAFFNCSTLVSVNIPKNVEAIGDQAFSYCSSLQYVTIGEGVTKIGKHVFNQTPKLVSVKFSNTNGWQISKTEDFSSFSSVSSDNLSNITTAKTLLTSTYIGYYWQRIE